MDFRNSINEKIKSFILIFLIGSTLNPISLLSVEMDSLYTVEISNHLTQSNISDSIYELALKKILIRITGNETIEKTIDIKKLFPNPKLYVRQFKLIENNKISITLDDEAIEDILRLSAVKIWSKERPVTLIWIAIKSDGINREILSSTEGIIVSGTHPISLIDNQTIKEFIFEAALNRGIPIRFPEVDKTDLQLISFVDIWGGFSDQIINASKRYNVQSILVGRVRNDELTNNFWTHYLFNHRGELIHEKEIFGSSIRAINILSDVILDNFFLQDENKVEEKNLVISGMNSISSLGEVESFLSSMDIINNFVIESIGGDKVQFKLFYTVDDFELYESFRSLEKLEEIVKQESEMSFNSSKIYEKFEFSFKDMVQ